MPITVTHAKSDTIANYTGTITQFNSTGGTVTVAATDFVRPIDWNSAHAGTLQSRDPEIGVAIHLRHWIDDATDTSGITAGIQSVPFYEPFFGQNTNSTLSTQGAGTWYLDPLNLPYCLGSGQLNILAADAAGFKNGAVYTTATTATITRNQTLQTVLALWKVGTGANITRIESIWSQAGFNPGDLGTDGKLDHRRRRDHERGASFQRFITLIPRAMGYFRGGDILQHRTIGDYFDTGQYRRLNSGG